jgi:hypothetical protein
MKSKYVVLASALLIQQRLCSKDEIKAAESVKKRKPKRQLLFYRVRNLYYLTQMMMKSPVSFVKETLTQIL